MIAKGVLFIDDISDQFHLSPGKTYIVKQLSFIFFNILNFIYYEYFEELSITILDRFQHDRNVKL